MASKPQLLFGIGLAADTVSIAIEALREAPLMAIKRRHTRRADLIATRVRVPGGQRIEDRLPFLCSH
jgi:hypothetical protein